MELKFRRNGAYQDLRDEITPETLHAKGLMIEPDRPANRRAYFFGENGAPRLLIYDTPKRRGVPREVVKQRGEGSGWRQPVADEKARRDAFGAGGPPQAPPLRQRLVRAAQRGAAFVPIQRQIEARRRLVIGGIGLQECPVLGHVGVAVLGDPAGAGEQLAVAAHVNQRNRAEQRAEPLGIAGQHIGDQQSAVRPALSRDASGLGHLPPHEVCGDGGASVATGFSALINCACSGPVRIPGGCPRPV